MIDLLKYLTQEITGSSDIDIKEEEASEGLKAYTVFSPKEEMGHLIGKEGKTIRAIRSLCRARAIIEKSSITVDIQEKTNT